MLFFLNCLVELTYRLEAKYKTYSKLKVILNERQHQVLAYLKEQETAKIKDIQESLEIYSRNTIKKDLAYLVNEGIIIKTGAGRGVEYHFKK